jgi:hypothetical protein
MTRQKKKKAMLILAYFWQFFSGMFNFPAFFCQGHLGPVKPLGGLRKGMDKTGMESG